jgi:phosphate:Na+ symporter
VNPIATLVEKIVPEKPDTEMQVDEPKFLKKGVLRYPETAISALLKESKYLYKKTIFEIVSHALNIHRADIKSDEKLKKIIKKSNVLFELDVREQYTRRIKSIYGQIINYATKAQSELDLNEAQNQQISEIKVANRKMVEIIRDVKELSKNITIYLNSDNKHIQKEYNKLRKRVAKVLRMIHLFRSEKDNEDYAVTLKKMDLEARSQKNKDNLELDTIIRKDLITVDMASSLVNDTDNVNDIIKNLISVASLLYGKKDTLLDNGDR